MKLRLLSDLHLEGNRYRYSHQGEDILVLAGDIHTRNRHVEILELVPKEVKIVAVAGNHEYYKDEFHNVNLFLKGLETEFPNYTFLNNSSTEIDGIDFFGGTMYTDFSLYGNAPLVEVDATKWIADFIVTRISDPLSNYGVVPRLWTTKDHKVEHKAFVKSLKRWIKETEGNKRRVVISHFVPCEQVIHARWKCGSLNPYFTADMTRFMGWPGLWLYGHTHDSGDTMIGETRVVGNPFGYDNGRENRVFNDRLLLEI